MANNLNLPSFAELLSGYQSQGGPADAINAGVQGAEKGYTMAQSQAKMKQDFLAKLAELGINKQKADAMDQNAQTNENRLQMLEGGKWTPVNGVLSKNNKPLQINSITGEMKEADSPEAQGMRGPGLAMVSNADFDHQPPQIQEAAKAYYEGRLVPSMRDRTLMGGLAQQYATKNSLPDFKGYAAPAAEATAKAFAAGKPAMLATGLNTALGHLQTAHDAYQNLGNLDVNLVNKPINWLRQNTNDPNVIKLDETLTAVQGEMANIFKQSGGTDQEIAKWEKTFNSNLTPAQAGAAIQQADELLRSRLSALDYLRQQGLSGRSEQPLLSPKGAAISQTLGGEQSTPPPAQTKPILGQDSLSAKKAALKAKLGL